MVRLLVLARRSRLGFLHPLFLVLRSLAVMLLDGFLVTTFRQEDSGASFQHLEHSG